MPALHALIVGPIELDAVATRVLGEIAGLVRSAQCVTDGGQHLIQNDDTDARVDSEDPAFPVEPQLRYTAPYAIGERKRIVAADSAQQRAEFITAQAREDIGAAQLLVDQPRNLTDQAIASRVSAGIVDDLELIEIQVEQSVLGAVTSASKSRRLLNPVSGSWVASYSSRAASARS